MQIKHARIRGGLASVKDSTGTPLLPDLLSWVTDEVSFIVDRLTAEPEDDEDDE